MSLQSATEFTSAIISNPALVSEVLKETDGKGEAEALSAISALGNSKGYDFTQEEAATLRHAFLNQLSDADLDNVAGGISIPGAGIVKEEVQDAGQKIKEIASSVGSGAQNFFSGW